MNINNKWKRVFAVGCSHAVYACPKAIAATLAFKAAYKPDITIHLGDAIDCTAFMGSHVKDGDGEPIEPDADAGLDYLKQLRPQVFLWGNHEHRVVRLRSHRNEFVRFAAADMIERIETRLALLKCKSVPYIGNRQKYDIGRVRFTHGTIYSENAIRDYATSYAPHKGAIVHAHTHRPGEATGLRVDEPIGMCVGTLTAQDAMEYANTRRATLGWGQAFVWGEICERTGNFQLWLHRHVYGQEWRLPV